MDMYRAMAHLGDRLVALRLAIAVVMLAVSCASQTSPTSPTSPPLPAGSGAGVARRVVVLGDSLAVTPSRSDSFPAQLQRMIEREGLGWTVTNAGISGDTTAGGVRRLDEVLAGDAGVLVLALGANDGLGGVDVRTVERNLATIIETARGRGFRVLLCGMETPPSRGWDYTLAFHAIYPRLADRYDVPLVPFLLTGVALVPEMNGSDGVHPNDSGARRIADNVWRYLQPMLRSPQMTFTGISPHEPSGTATELRAKGTPQ